MTQAWPHDFNLKTVEKIKDLCHHLGISTGEASLEAFSFQLEKHLNMLATIVLTRDKLPKINQSEDDSLSNVLTRNAELESALAKLVNTKRIKDTQGKTPEYERLRTEAWEAAEKLVQLSEDA